MDGQCGRRNQPAVEANRGDGALVAEVSEGVSFGMSLVAESAVSKFAALATELDAHFGERCVVYSTSDAGAEREKALFFALPAASRLPRSHSLTHTRARSHTHNVTEEAQ